MSVETEPKLKKAKGINFDNIRKGWDRKEGISHRLGSPEEFLSWLEVSEDDLSSMDFSDLEELDVIKEHGLTSLAGNKSGMEYTWRWEFDKYSVDLEEKPYLENITGGFEGRGNTHGEAALHALVTFWEIIYGRTDGDL